MRIIVSAGGTGGHLYPALALVEYIEKKDKNAKFLFVGTTDRLESKVVPERGYDYEGLHVKGFVGNPLQKAKNVMIFVKSLAQSRKIIKKFKPDIVIGFGGYPSASIVLAASQMGIRTVIHEQNSIIGLTNKILIKRVDKIVCCYEKAYNEFPKEKTYLLGNPRASVVSEQSLRDVHDIYGIDKNKKILVIVMGSLGSASVNNIMKDALKKFNVQDTEVLFATGQTHFEAIKAEMKNINPSIHVLPYIEDMPSVLSSADLVVSRAGATTLAEITAIGAAAIVVPSPYVVANHQEYNARELSDKQAAHLLLEKDLNVNSFLETVNELMNNPLRRDVLKTNALSLGKPNACKDMYELILDLCERK